jgi:hypothetical protein
LVGEVGSASRQAGGGFVGDDKEFDRRTIHIQTFVFEIVHAQ